METLQIECKLIDVPKVSGDKRTFSKEFAVKMADSLKVDGQLNPIVVRPNPVAAGRFILVAGKHRLYGMKNVLKEQFIRCTVCEDMDADEADIAADVENLWRNPLNKAQHAGAVKRWHAHWLAKPPVVESKAKKSTPVGGPSDVDHYDQSAAAEPTTAAAPVATAANEAEFNEKVAAVTGQSVVSVRRSKAIAKAFTDDQLEVFTQMETNQTDMLTVAKIKDEGHRAEVVALIASGMVAADAIAEVMKDKPPRSATTTTRRMPKGPSAKAKAKVEREPELTDDEWFENNCGEKAGMLGDVSRFKSDAILFRSVSDFRHAFRVEGEEVPRGHEESGGHRGLLEPREPLHRPSATPRIGSSAPSARDRLYPASPGPSARCGRCFGGGYLLKTEEFL